MYYYHYKIIIYYLKLLLLCGHTSASNDCEYQRVTSTVVHWTVVTGELPGCRAGASDSGDGRFIASSAAQSGAGSRVCGSESSPWQVEASPGQKLRFTLHDFAVQPAAAAAAAAGQSLLTPLARTTP